MNKTSFNFDSVTDSELFDKILFYLSSLSHCLPFKYLRCHCLGAIASIFELSYYLSSHNLSDYGNNKK